MDPETLERLLHLRRELPVAERYAYLNHAAIGAMPRRSAERLAALAATVSQTGDRHWPERNAEAERVRGLAARLIGARHDHELALDREHIDLPAEERHR